MVLTVVLDVPDSSRRGSSSKFSIFFLILWHSLNGNLFVHVGAACGC